MFDIITFIYYVIHDSKNRIDFIQVQRLRFLNERDESVQK